MHPQVRAQPTPTGVDWDSWGYDLQRTGYNPNETTVGNANVGSLQQIWSVNVGRAPVPEPVLAGGVMIDHVPTNVLYAGSNYGEAMYAINADTGAVIWKHTVAYASYMCGTRLEQWSVGASPAIDRGKNLIYFGDGLDHVHALDLSTGKSVYEWPITISIRPQHDNMHGGFTYNPANGILYAVTSSICDNKNWNGRIVAIDTVTRAILGTFFPVSGTSTPGGSGGGIWGGGGGSIDASTNDVLVATGNASVAAGIPQNAGYAENIVALSSDVNTVLAANYPQNIPVDPGHTDYDFGSTPMIFQPPGCPEMTAVLNKSGMFELYDVATIGQGPVQYIQMSISTDTGDFQGSPAYDPVTNLLYIELPATYGTYQPGLGAFGIQADCTINPTPVWSAAFGPDGAASGAETARSAITVANGVVYVGNSSGRQIFAYDAAAGTQLWSTTTSGWSKHGTIVANGIVYVTDSGGNITAWAPSGIPGLRRR